MTTEFLFCFGITALFNHAGLQRTAAAVIGQEITHLRQWERTQHHMRMHAGSNYKGKIEKRKKKSSVDELKFI